MDDNPAALEEKRYVIHGKEYVLRPMTIRKEIAYLTILDQSKDEFSTIVDNPLQMMEKIAEKIPEILSIALNPAIPTSIETLREEIAEFPSAKVEEIVNDFFDFNQSWQVGLVSERLTRIMGIVMGRNIRPQANGETQSSD